MKIDKYFHLYGRKDDVVFEEIPPMPQWIPVSEKLPEEQYEVLVTAWSLVMMAWIEDGEWVTSEFTFDRGFDVVAWMPLPEPYKEGDKNE